MNIKVTGYDEYVRDYEKEIHNKEDYPLVTEEEVLKKAEEKLQEIISAQGEMDEFWVELPIHEPGNYHCFIFDGTDSEEEYVVRYVGDFE